MIKQFVVALTFVSAIGVAGNASVLDCTQQCDPNAPSARNPCAGL